MDLACQIENSTMRISDLVAAMKKDADALVREHAAEALGDIGPDAASAVPDLIVALKDDNARVRRDAARR